MDKIIFQDVMPPKRSIRSIPLTKDKRNMNMVPITEVKEPEKKPKIVRSPKFSFGGLFRYLVVIFALVAVGIGVFAVMSLFASSELEVYPKKVTVDTDVVLESFKDKPGASLIHIVVTASTTNDASVESNKERAFDERAKGVITIFNNYSTAEQRLIKNTRFETADGRIYRIDSSVVVPGQKEDGGSKIPGSIDAVVYGDLAGEEYNLTKGEAGQFSVPGFKGTPRFDYFYGELKTDIVGGFSGTRKYLEDNESAPVRKSLREEILTELQNKIKVGIPSNYIMIPDGFYVEYFDNSDTVVDNKVVVSVSGTAYAILVGKLDLSDSVAEVALDDYDGSDLEIANIDKLTMAIDNPPGKPWQSDSLVINLSGSAEFIWSIDDGAVISAIAGKPKTQIKDILSGYEEIDRAEIIIKPFWLSNFPSDKEKIKLTVVLDAE